MIESFFRHGEAGQLYCQHYQPGDGRPVERCLLHVPAFAEEMNKSRRVVASTARALAEQGVATLLVDLYGCGDSAGDFGQATLATWLADLQGCREWLRAEHGCEAGLWGLRLGALLCMELLAQDPRASHLLLWQPVTRGETAINEFLRLKVAAQMMGAEGEPAAAGSGPEGVSTKGLRAALEAGEAQEIAGYELPGPLASALFDLSLGSRGAPACPVYWMEIVRETGRPLLPASRRVIEAWSEAGHGVETRAVVGEPFWRTLEIAECPALMQETVTCVASG